jgi:hypothetical protein
MAESPASFRLKLKERELLKKYGDIHKLLERLEYLESYFAEQKVIYDTENECQRRLVKNEKFYCIQTDWKGLRAQKELLSVEVCRICKIKRFQLKEASLSTPQEAANKIEKQPTEKPLLCPQSGEPFQADPYCIQCQKLKQQIWFRCDARKYWRKTGKITVKA